MSEIDTSTKAIAAIMDSVTPGPWATTMGKLLRVVVPKKRPVVVCGVHKSGSRGGEDAGGSAEANARFIAASRRLVPALAAERDAMRAEVERLSAVAAKVTALVEASTALRDQIARWHHGGPAAGPEESRALFEALDDAIAKWEAAQ